MKLEQIGFYTLSDYRAKNTSQFSRLWRCELILTTACNFKCPYCKSRNTSKPMPFDDAKSILSKWADAELKNVRFSGGEPTLWKKLPQLVSFAKENCVERIAISTNGYSDLGYYIDLIDRGVSDFSISLDACCSSVGDEMSGGVLGSWDTVVTNIRELSKLTYVTVGVVLTNDNITELSKIIEFAYGLGVSDIRIISAAQWNSQEEFVGICKNEKILESYPILKYRVNNFNNGRNVRGITESDSHKCYLMLDDMVVENNKHYPCVIYMREGGKHIGSVYGNSIKEIRSERAKYFNSTNTHKNRICRDNCLDICIDYNNTSEMYNLVGNRNKN